MRKAKYKPWQVSANQEWILINAVTKWATSQGFLPPDKQAGSACVRAVSWTFKAS